MTRRRPWTDGPFTPWACSGDPRKRWAEAWRWERLRRTVLSREHEACARTWRLGAPPPWFLRTIHGSLSALELAGFVWSRRRSAPAVPAWVQAVRLGVQLAPIYGPQPGGLAWFRRGASAAHRRDPRRLDLVRALEAARRERRERPRLDPRRLP